MSDLLDIKTGLLKTLRSAPEKAGWSTAELATELSCDQQQLHGAISELETDGYRFESSRELYRLVVAPDIPYPFEFPGRQDRIHYFPQITSTMDEARKAAGRGCPDLTVIIAGAQTKGRGRMDRVWASDEGGLYFTLVIKPRAHPAEAIKFNFLASLTLVEVLREECRIDARVKWPNDIMVDNSKLSGMLSEMDATGDTIHFVSIGIGVNVNNDPALIEPRAVSLRSLTGRAFSRPKILGRFLDRFESGLKEAAFPLILARWKQFAGCLNREVTIVTLKETLNGFAEDVDDQGSLVLRLADGTRRTVCYGDCFYG
jgi:BirA family biotin operon repressor/biotin-[acetyl-CoA-carboxylase] ligase